VVNRTPWWLEEAPPDPEQPALAGNAEADVAIVGGGYTCLWTAPAELGVPERAVAVELTEPVPELLSAIGWTGGEAIADARMFLHYFRTTAGGRVLMGSESGPIGRSGRIDARFFTDEPTVARAEQGLRRLLPGLAAARVEWAWRGPIASLVLGADDEWTGLPLARRVPPRLPPEPVRHLGGALVRRSILSVEAADEAERRPSPVARGVSALPRVLGLRIGTR
jgi:glycine/D-amino acid oxidase-like deaminating enzyme